MKIKFLVCFLYIARFCFAAELCLEAEDFQSVSGWKVIRGFEGYFPAQPAFWSGNRIKADIDTPQAVATRTVSVPEKGTYNLWVRYESSAGFNALFTVEIVQSGKRMLLAEFGGKGNFKYFLFGRKWQIHKLWAYHNSDYVYEKATCELEKGRATITIRKGENNFSIVSQDK